MWCWIGVIFDVGSEYWSRGWIWIVDIVRVGSGVVEFCFALSLLLTDLIHHLVPIEAVRHYVRKGAPHCFPFLYCIKCDRFAIA